MWTTTKRHRIAKQFGLRKHGIHNQLDHGLWAHGSISSVRTSSTDDELPFGVDVMVQAYLDDENGRRREAGRLEGRFREGVIVVGWVRTNTEFRSHGLATKMAEKLHEAYPDQPLRHGGYSSREGYEWALAMQRRYPEWNIVPPLTYEEELELDLLPVAKRFNPSQPRDPFGRWVDLRGAETDYEVPRGPSAARWEEATYQGAWAFPDNYPTVFRGQKEREAIRHILNLGEDSYQNPHPNEMMNDLARGKVVLRTRIEVDTSVPGERHEYPVTEAFDADTGKRLDDPWSYTWGDAARDVEVLDAAFAKPALRTKRDLVVYKGVSTKLVEDLGSGDVLGDLGFASAGITPGTGMSVMGSDLWNQTGMQVFIPAGFPLIVDRRTDYSEVVFPRGTRFRIIDQYTDREDYPAPGPGGGDWLDRPVPGKGFKSYMRVVAILPKGMKKDFNPLQPQMRALQDASRRSAERIGLLPSGGTLRFPDDERIAKHLPGQHNQLDHGRRGFSVASPSSPEGVRQMTAAGARAFIARAASYGVPELVGHEEAWYRDNASQLVDEIADNLAFGFALGSWAGETKERAERVFSSPRVAPLVEKYGAPTVIASDVTMHGDLPFIEGTFGSSFMGIMGLFDPNLGVRVEEDQPFPLKSHEGPPVPGGTVRWGNYDTVIRHEYGHYIYDLAKVPSRPGNPDLFAGQSGKEVVTRVEAHFMVARSLGDDLDRAKDLAFTEGLGVYGLATPHEFFAEAFAVVTSEGYDGELRRRYSRTYQDFLVYMEELLL